MLFCADEEWIFCELNLNPSIKVYEEKYGQFVLLAASLYDFASFTRNRAAGICRTSVSAVQFIQCCRKFTTLHHSAI